MAKRKKSKTLSFLFLEAATSAIVRPAIRASVKNLNRAQVSEVTRKAGTAVLITYGADSNPDPVTGKVRRLDVQRYEFWRNGAQVILTLTAPQGADNVDPWRVVTDSFGWL